MHRNNRMRRIGWITMTVMATGLALFSARYFTLDKAMFLATQATVYAAHLDPLLLHVGGGVTALAVGPWQFWTNLRTRHPRVHRTMGRDDHRAWLGLAATGLPFAQLYAVGSWTTRLFDLLVAELLIAAMVRPRTAHRAARAE